jgi:hypothetical protein
MPKKRPPSADQIKRATARLNGMKGAAMRAMADMPKMAPKAKGRQKREHAHKGIHMGSSCK